MHLMPGQQPPALLTSSLQYGVVARSLPLTGRILKGYLDASGTGLGVGNNNPNVEFSPNVTACSMTSDGPAAKIVWGFRTGEVAVMTALKTMAIEGGRRAGANSAKLVRCRGHDYHDAAVLGATWVWGNKTAFVTGGADGRIKLWDPKGVNCLWTSEPGPELVADAVLKVSLGNDGTIIGALRSGNLVIYTGLQALLLKENSFSSAGVVEIRVPCPIADIRTFTTPGVLPEIGPLQIWSFSTEKILAAYKSPSFYRVTVRGTAFELVQFGERSVPISCITTSFARPGHELAEMNLILTGDQLGSINIYDWDAVGTGAVAESVKPIHEFHAHAFPITSLAQSPDSVVLISGSVDGEIKVWDALSFTLIRTFTFLSKALGPGVDPDGNNREAVEQIVVEGDMLVAYARTRVMSWKAGRVRFSDLHHNHGHRRIGVSLGKGRRDRSHVKYQRTSAFSIAFFSLRMFM